MKNPLGTSAGHGSALGAREEDNLNLRGLLRFQGKTNAAPDAGGDVPERERSTCAGLR